MFQKEEESVTKMAPEGVQLSTTLLSYLSTRVPTYARPKVGLRFDNIYCDALIGRTYIYQCRTYFRFSFCKNLKSFHREGKFSVFSEVSRKINFVETVFLSFLQNHL